jgi:hypothetical protein
MFARHSLISLGLVLLAATACREAAAPASWQGAPALQADVLGAEISAPTAGSQLHILKQGTTAPQLETYQVSFWAVKGRASGVKVKYQDGHQFLQFDIPKAGLASGAGGARLRTGDSVLITLSIDAATFDLDFQPAGVQFSSRSPATLQLWFANANPDLNGDGVVDATDDLLSQQLDFWYQATTSDPWVRLSSQRDLAQKWVLTDLYHFSGYAVSW